jgi:chorismate dehydratase
MIRLGHIDYSNCVPVHSQLLERQRPEGIRLVMGVPSELNDALLMGQVDVAPCSSIEYARHADRYVLLPDLVIGSDGAVGSILLESEHPPEALGGRMVWLPTASATSAILLRILLEVRWGVKPEYAWFHQTDAGDPIGIRASAVLRIGDVALRRVAPEGRHVIDLGAAWTEWTGLPFAYALWQARRDAPADELRRLHRTLIESRAWFEQHDAEVAGRHAARFHVEPAALLAYWRSLRFHLDGRMREGLLHFYELAAGIDEAKAPVATLEWLPGCVTS